MDMNIIIIQCIHLNRIKYQPSDHKTFLLHLYNSGPTSKTLGRRCINVIEMFCVYWEYNNIKNIYIPLGNRLVVVSRLHE